MKDGVFKLLFVYVFTRLSDRQSLSQPNFAKALGTRRLDACVGCCHSVTFIFGTTEHSDQNYQVLSSE